MRSQKTAFVNGLCTLSRDVKRLTVREFNDRFDCDVVEMITRQLAQVGGGSGGGEEEEDGGGGSSSSGKKRNRVMGMQQQQQQRQFSTATAATAGMMSWKTPAVGRFGGGGGRPPMTIARTARKGERLIVQ